MAYIFAALIIGTTIGFINTSSPKFVSENGQSSPTCYQKDKLLESQSTSLKSPSFLNCSSESTITLSAEMTEEAKKKNKKAKEDSAKEKIEEDKYKDYQDKIKANTMLHYKTVYPRFSITAVNMIDQNYYGIHTEDYSDVKRFLGERECSSPNLSYVDLDTGYTNLFLSLNQGRHFGGIIRIINEKFITLIEGDLSFQKIENYFKEKQIPSADFMSWVHKDWERDFKGWVYQVQRIGLKDFVDRGGFFLSPWLHNHCNKSMSVISNICSLDPSFDMELKDFFYMTKTDQVFGNIYCKKSSDTSWHRLAIIEFIRTK